MATPEHELPGRSEATPVSPAELERFVRLFSAFHSRLHAFILTLLPHHDDAAEVLQETSLVLWRRFADFDETKADFSRWACGIAFNIVRKYRRERLRDRLYFSEALLADIAEVRQQHGDYLDERRDALAACLQKLREGDRRIIDAYYHQNITAVKIAEKIQHPVNTVYKALQRIRLTLMQCIDRSIAAEGGA